MWVGEAVAMEAVLLVAVGMDLELRAMGKLEVASMEVTAAAAIEAAWPAGWMAEVTGVGVMEAVEVGATMAAAATGVSMVGRTVVVAAMAAAATGVSMVGQMVVVATALVGTAEAVVEEARWAVVTVALVEAVAGALAMVVVVRDPGEKVWAAVASQAQGVGAGTALEKAVAVKVLAARAAAWVAAAVAEAARAAATAETMGAAIVEGTTAASRDLAMVVAPEAVATDRAPWEEEVVEGMAVARLVVAVKGLAVVVVKVPAMEVAGVGSETMVAAAAAVHVYSIAYRSTVDCSTVRMSTGHRTARTLQSHTVLHSDQQAVTSVGE